MLPRTIESSITTSRLPRIDGLQGVQLQPDAQLADGLGGLDEGPAHVGVLDQALREGDAGFLGVADGGRGAGLRHGDHEVGLTGCSRGQLAAHLHPGIVDGAAGDGGVRAGQVDVFEDAAGRRRLGETLGAHPVLVDRDEFAGLNFADEGGADGGQGGCSEATTQPRSSRPRTSGRIAVVSRAA